MNSNRLTQLALVLMVAALLAGQWRESKRFALLEAKVAMLQQDVENQQAVQPVLAKLEPRHPQDIELPGLEQFGLEGAEAALMTASIPEPRARRARPVRESRLVTEPSPIPQLGPGWRELTEEELGMVVAGELAPAAGMAGIAAAGPGPTPAAPTLPNPEPPAAESTAQQLAPRVEKGGVLLRKGRTQIEPTVSYSHLSKNRVGLSGFSIFDVIFIGEIQAEEVDRDLVTSSLNVRHGLTDTLQVEVELPAQFQREETLSGPIEDRIGDVSHHAGANDISAAMYYQFKRETQNAPAMIAHARVKMPTGDAPRFGSGVWGLKTGLLFVKSSDPVVLFSNLGYTHTFSGDINGVDVNPGNSFEYNLGMAYALNYNLAANASFEQVFVGESTSRDRPVLGSRLIVANLKAGLTYALTKNFSVDFSVGTGLTEDSPDFTATLSFPYTF